MEAKNVIEQIATIRKDVDHRRLEIIGGNRAEYDFSDYKTFKELFRDFYYKKIQIDDAEANQIQFDTVFYNLNKYSPKNTKYTEAKNDLVKNVENFCEGRNKIIEGFKNNIFLVCYNETQVETSESNEEINITDMPDLESEKPAAERNVTKKNRIKNIKIKCNQRERKENK